jgi:hypothetical protein
MLKQDLKALKLSGPYKLTRYFLHAHFPKIMREARASRSKVQMIAIDLKCLKRLIKDLLFWNRKKKLALYNQVPWHFQTLYPFRLDQYVSTLHQCAQYYPIRINLTSLFHVRILSNYLHSKPSIDRQDLNFFFLIWSIFRSLKTKKSFSTKNDIFNHQPTNVPVTSDTTALWDISIRKSVINKLGSYSAPFDKYQHNVSLTFSKELKRWLSIKKHLTTILIHPAVQALGVPQQSYHDQILQSLALEYGLNVFRLECAHSDLTILTPNSLPLLDRLANYYDGYKTHGLSRTLINNAAQTLQNRIAGNFSSPTMGYMANLKHKPHQSISASIPSKTCILFLHAFTDAPNYGIECAHQRLFNDYFHHAVYVINLAHALKVPLLIKAHPNNSLYPKDKPLIDYLQKMVADAKRNDLTWFCEWLPPSLPNEHIKKFKEPFAISARGSVMLECGFLGIPICITSAHPWESYSFVYRAQTLNQLEQYMNNPYNDYCPATAKKSATTLQAILENKIWHGRPKCINIYNTVPGHLSKTEKQMLLERSLTL